MKIGIEARVLILNERGISNYISNLIGQLAKIDKKNEYFIYVNSERHHTIDKKKAEQIVKTLSKHKNITIRNIKSKNDFLWEQIYLPFKVLKDRIDVLHMTSNRSPLFVKCKLISTVHDVIEFELIEEKLKINNKLEKGTPIWKALLFEFRIPYRYHQKYMGTYIKLMYKNTFRKNDMVLTISKKSKKDIQKRLNVNPNKIKIIHHGIENDFKNKKTEKKYIMSFGGTMKHKNPEGCVESYSFLPSTYKEKYPLLIVGAENPSEWEKILKKYNIKNYIINGFVPRNELIQLYNKSKVFLFLSVIEGFGFPPLEAMACGTVPLVYNVGPMKDNVGSKEFCVDFKNNKQVAERITELIDNKKKYKNLVSYGLRRSKEFSWEKCAASHLNAYKKVCNSD